MIASARKRGCSESGYTLAGVLIVLTIVMVIIAYTVPTQWSSVIKREREHQTLFVMEQYARAIAEYNAKTGGLPTSMDQLEEFNNPYVLRKRWVNPLSGEDDWILVPPGTQPSGQTGQAQPGQPQNGQPQQGQPVANPGQTSPFPGGAGGDSDSYSGPFVGVRPPQTGPAIVIYQEAENYEDWLITSETLAQEDQGQNQTPQPDPTPDQGN